MKEILQLLAIWLLLTFGIAGWVGTQYALEDREVCSVVAAEDKALTKTILHLIAERQDERARELLPQYDRLNEMNEQHNCR